MAVSTATEPPTQRKFGLTIWASIISSFSVPWPTALARICSTSQAWDRTTKHSTLHISVTYSSQRDMVSDHGGSSLRGQRSIAIFADFCMPVASSASTSGMELWPCTTQAYRLVREFPQVNRVLHPFISIRRM